uniref:Mitogen-activated protein kinase kinase kinase 19 n=1 Tax=Tetraodon nigroviridis TaxID=99883 RepID=H3CQ38_TETNG
MFRRIKVLHAQDILPTLSPKLLEPISRRAEEHAGLPVLRDRAPLKFIRNISLSSWTHPRTERPRGRPRTGPLATKGGSEESGSSSSSIDLEDEGDSEAGDGGLVRMTVGKIPLNHRSAYSGKAISASRLSPEQGPDFLCGGKVSNPKQPAHRQTLRSTVERGKTGNFNASATSEFEEEVKSNAGQTPEAEVSHEEKHEAQGEPDECCEGNLRRDLLTKPDFQVESREDVKLQTEEKSPSSNLSESNTGVSGDSRKVASQKERRMRAACSQRSNTGTNQRSFNKNSRSPSSHCDISSPLPKKKGSDKTRRLKVKVSSNRVPQLPALRQLKDSHLLKRPSFAGLTRSKSAVDVITYNDMFQRIQNGGGGPAIYEMFAGPLYDNLRASSSCDQVQDRKVQSAMAACRPLKHTHEGKSQAAQVERTVASANDRPKHGSSRRKNITVSCKKTKKINSTNKHDGREKAESALPGGPDYSHAQEKGKEEMLSTIEESATFKSDIRTLTVAAGSSRNILETKGNTWEPLRGSSPAIMSPVYQKFLDDVGDGPLTDDLLQCLAEELISLDERDASTGTCETEGPSQEKPDTENDPGSGKQEPSKPEPSAAGCDPALADDAITWTKGEVLGKGAYGIVYCGLTSHGQLVAVKQVSLDASDPDAAEGEYARLQGEVELLKTLRHANIVGFLGTSFHQQVVSIFMEYIPGGSIASILHRFGPLPERVLALYTKQILEGVAYLHLNKVIHRDLKGNNIMLMPTGIVKLIDFGCARRLSCLSHNASNSADLLKSVHGTPYWMAPEVINDSGYGRKSDIWSVGCTVFEMATGKPPLAHMDKMAALFYIGAQRGIMPSLPNGFSETAKDFVETCLIRDQRLRPPAKHLLKHPFIHQNTAIVNTSQALKIRCSGPTCS